MEKISPHLPASSAPYFLSFSLHVAPGLLYFFIFIMLISNAGLLYNISLCLTQSSISFHLNNTYPFFRTQNSVMSELSLLIPLNTSNLSLLPLIHWIHIIKNLLCSRNCPIDWNIFSSKWNRPNLCPHSWERQ